MVVQLSISQGTVLRAFPPVLWILGFPIQHNYFETSHAKGEQDAAGSHVKQQASLAVIHGRADITDAKQLCDHLTGNLSKPAQSSFPSRSTAVSLKRRLFFYVPEEGEVYNTNPYFGLHFEKRKKKKGGRKQRKLLHKTSVKTT